MVHAFAQGLKSRIHVRRRVGTVAVIRARGPLTRGTGSHGAAVVQSSVQPPPNISVKGTSRKRAALYVRRYALVQSHMKNQAFAEAPC